MNSVNDQETADYNAMDYLDTIAHTLRHYDVPLPLQSSKGCGIPWETSSFVTHIVYLQGSSIAVDHQAIEVSRADGVR